MFSVLGRPYRHCDGLTRRVLLRAGALGMGGLTLSDLLRAEHDSGVGSSHKAVINVHLDGGPPQQDMIDPKPQAPAEFRGEFSACSTSLPGIAISELLPRIAAAADKFVFIRSLVGSQGAHDAYQCQSGFHTADLAGIGGRPTMGCVLTKLLGSPEDLCPTFVDLMQGRPMVRNSARPGFLGSPFQPFRPDISEMFSRPLEKGMMKELAVAGGDRSSQLKLIGGISADRITDRTSLLNHLDQVRRRLDNSDGIHAMDRFQQQALSILTSGRFADALDLSKEDPRIVSKYTLPAAQVPQGRFHTSDEPLATRKFLLARRLVEAGVRCVSISISDFDTHKENFVRCRQIVPIFDFGLQALIDDLDQRGMLDDVSVVVWGEFGRTPKINKDAGRDHWPRVGMAMMAGGGIRAGQVIGATDRLAGSATSRPVDYQDVFATLYHNLGINARQTTVSDMTDRPHFLLDHGEPLQELL